MALLELRKTLPHGDVGRLINSYIFPHHPDTAKETLEFWLKIKAPLHEAPSYVSAAAFLGKLIISRQSYELKEETFAGLMMYEFWIAVQLDLLGEQSVAFLLGDMQS